MPSVCLYLTAHLPYQLKSYPKGEIGRDHQYFDEVANASAVNRLSDKSLLPVNRLLQKLIEASENKFRVSFSLSGTLLELLQKYRPDVIRSFQSLVTTGCVDILGETYYQSCSSLYSEEEFVRQVEMHRWMIKNIFSVTPVLFRNSELIHQNHIVSKIRSLGFEGILCEGVARILKGRDPNRIYAAPGEDDFPILLRNRELSNDIAFRFDDQYWNEYPLTAEKFAGWIHRHPQDTCVINLMLNYTTFGIHKTGEAGIFSFLENLPSAVLAHDSTHFALPVEAIHRCYPRDLYDVPHAISWRDHTGACFIWNRNSIQNQVLKKIAALENLVIPYGDYLMMDTWGKLQSVDHLLDLSETMGAGTPSGLPSDNSISINEKGQNFQHILTDFEVCLIKSSLRKIGKHTIPYSVGALY